jgi:hypothetical protein
MADQSQRVCRLRFVEDYREFAPGDVLGGSYETFDETPRGAGE